MKPIYNNLISSYLTPHNDMGKRNLRVRAGKELLDHYSAIVKKSKTTPMYIINLTDEKQEYAIGLKELSLSLGETVEDYRNNIESALCNIAPYTSDDGIEATIVSKEELLPEDMDVIVNNMATRQVNVGFDYYGSGRGLPGGSYGFSAKVDGKEYRFRYSMKDGTSNSTVLSNLAKTINDARIGINAEVKNLNPDKIYLQLTSEKTGADGMHMFEFIDDDNSNKLGIVSYYGLDQVSVAPENASIDINGVNYVRKSNKLVLNGSLELIIKKESEKPVHVGYVKDHTEAVHNLSEVLDAYNEIVDLSYRHAESKETRNQRIRSDLKGIYENNKMELASAGVEMDERGYLYVNEDVVKNSFIGGVFEDVLGKESKFLADLSSLANRVALNPMEYVNKLMVAYPDYSREGYAHPYMTSIYSGMLFNYYC
ncbi:MAG: hypothetical protein E7265_05070 [Lachnospiraceae bacterium]|nr:hypothetical protein [Lachnospiraceae bacterium]